ncbi:MAG TPA: 50S ribosomal protein L29 [Ignavibacteriaceae bacterium]|nr:50S ribosomal protein L29 [Ignavibacteriaceae bacterium]
MKIYEIKEMNNDELIKRIAEEEKNLVDLQFAHQLKQLTNTAKLNIVTKDIARMKTILKEREMKAVQKAGNDNKEGVKS